jgi:hypothetical protein
VLRRVIQYQIILDDPLCVGRLIDHVYPGPLGFSGSCGRRLGGSRSTGMRTTSIAREHGSCTVPADCRLCPSARYWGAQFEWLAHRRAAVQAGLSEDKVKAIAEGRRPLGMSADEDAVYNFITELFKTKQSSDAAFAAIKSFAGECGVVDLIVSTGCYQAVSMLMNTDRLPVKPTISRN